MPWRLLMGVLAAAAIAAALGCRADRDSEAAAFDLLIRGGLVFDGRGHAPTRADVAIVGDRIAAVGMLAHTEARREIDARGKLVAPGFIDAHSHAAPSLTRPPLSDAHALLAQGVTTVVINPDGQGPVDLAAQRRELEAARPGVNVVPLIGHGAVRRDVLGMADRPPTDDELVEMRTLVRRAMDAGAFGLSSGLFYAPGSYAATDELIALMEVVAEFDGVHSSHIRDEGNYSIGLVAAVDEIIRIAEATGTIGITTHLKALGPDSWGQAEPSIVRIEEARARGVRVYADQYPYEASSTSVTGALMPRWAEADGRIALGQRLGDGGTRRRLLAEVAENIRRRGGPASLVVASFAADRSLEGRRLEAIALSRGMSAEEVALNLVERGDASLVSFNMSIDDIEAIMRQPWTMTSSDGVLAMPGEGRPHPRGHGAFARKLAVFVRERGTVALEQALYSMTGLPAEVFGLADRGVLREGAAADVVVFDPAAVGDRATYEDPHQLADGMSVVIVNGAIASEDGRFTDAGAGRVLGAAPRGRHSG